MNIFEAVKGSVTTRQAAEMYGIQVRRNGMARCPFHNDRNPSMKVDSRFHCFGCQADGDVIDFVGRLYGLGSKAAAEKLAADFGISYDSKWKAPPRRVSPVESELQRNQREEKHCYLVLCEYLHLLKAWQELYAPRSPDEEWHPLFTEALQKMSHVEYLLEVLLTGTEEEKKQLVCEHRKDVKKLEERIRNHAARADSYAGDADTDASAGRRVA